MFNDETKKWLKVRGIRILRSMAITALSIIPTTGATMGSVDWTLVVSSVCASAIVTALICIKELPED